MLARLSIRDIVLIERLDIEFSRGLEPTENKNSWISRAFKAI